MKILLDQGTPAPLRRYLQEHLVETAFERQWSSLTNGELLDAAEENGFELLVTTDQQLGHQQNLTGRRLAILVLQSTSWPRIQTIVDEIRELIDSMSPGDYVEFSI